MKHTLGPITVLMSHLRRLGWTVHPGFKIVTQTEKTFELHKLTTGQFESLLHEAWEAELVPKLRTKQGLDELQFFSIAASSWENNDPQLDGFMAKLRGGGIFTNGVKSKINQDTSAACKLCGEPDSLHHKVYDCSALDQLRQELNWDVLQSVPKQALLGGLFPRQPSLRPFLDALDRIAVPSIQPAEYGNCLHLFTDGSCSQPGQGHLSERKAAWSVVQAKPRSCDNTVLASGVLPGSAQSSFRAELFAILMAVQFSNHLVLHTDCMAVFRGISRLLKDRWDDLFWKKSEHYHLRKQLWENVCSTGTRLHIKHVLAHRSVAQAKKLRRLLVYLPKCRRR